MSSAMFPKGPRMIRRIKGQWFGKNESEVRTDEETRTSRYSHEYEFKIHPSPTPFFMSDFHACKRAFYGIRVSLLMTYCLKLNCMPEFQNSRNFNLVSSVLASIFSQLDRTTEKNSLFWKSLEIFKKYSMSFVRYTPWHATSVGKHLIYAFHMTKVTLIIIVV